MGFGVGRKLEDTRGGSGDVTCSVILDEIHTYILHIQIHSSLVARTLYRL